MMHFGPIALSLDLTITLGNVLSLVGTLGGVLAAYIKIVERLTRIETQLGPVWKWWQERRR